MRTFAGLLLPVLVVTLLFSLWRWESYPPEQPVYPVSRTIKYSLTVRNPSHEPVAKAAFWVSVPLASAAYQVRDEIQTSHLYRLETDSLGNQRLVFEVTNLPPYAKRSYSVTARVRLASTPNRTPEILAEDYLSEAPYVEIGDREVQSLARQLEGDTTQQTVENTFRWITANIRKSGYTKREHGSVQTLQTKKGDCTDVMYLFSALSRANAIPSRNLAGFLVSESARLNPRDYHNWVEVYVDGRWRLIDPDKRVFMDSATQYIAMSLLDAANARLTEEQSGLFGGTENIHLSMN
ncbi:MAG: transglutaminase domain-containing protein [Candidatus Thiodiazotropha sp.]